MPTIVKLKKEGLPRVVNGAVGMTFIVDKFTRGLCGPVAHVRDYRFKDGIGAPSYQIWSLAADQYEIVRQDPTEDGPEVDIIRFFTAFPNGSFTQGIEIPS